MPELTYPLERAEAFAAAHRARPPAWLPAFEALLARYRGFVDALDRVRRVSRGRNARQALAGPLADVRTAARALRRALSAERR